MIFNDIDDTIHNTAEQIKRFEKAADKNLTLLNVNPISQTAQFVGSEGDIYKTSLLGCTCIDYSMRKLPCKHMYRLAIECGLINPDLEPWHTYNGYSKILNKAKKMLNSLNILQLNEVIEYIKNYEH